MNDTKKGIAEQSEMGLSLEDLIRRGARELIQKAIEAGGPDSARSARADPEGDRG